jgi:hypothetical protein
VIPTPECGRRGEDQRLVGKAVDSVIQDRYFNRTTAPAKLRIRLRRLTGNQIYTPSAAAALPPLVEGADYLGSASSA